MQLVPIGSMSDNPFFGFADISPSWMNISDNNRFKNSVHCLLSLYRATNKPMDVPKAPVKTGGVVRMKEPHGEGVAIHTGPESCGWTSNGVAEALAGVRPAQVHPLFPNDVDEHLVEHRFLHP